MLNPAAGLSLKPQFPLKLTGTLTRVHNAAGTREKPHPSAYLTFSVLHANGKRNTIYNFILFFLPYLMSCLIH